MIDLKSGKLIQTLSFKCKPNMKNMIVRSVQILRDSSIVTLHTYPQEPSYMIKWTPQDLVTDASKIRWKQEYTTEVHKKPSAGFKVF